MKPFKFPALLTERPLARYHAHHPETGEAVPDPVVESLATAVRAARDKAAQIVAAGEALAADTTRTAGERARRRREVALRLGEAAAKVLDQACAKAQAEVARLEASMVPSPPGDPAAAAMASELRARLAAMSKADRARALDRVLAVGADDAVAALVSDRTGLLTGTGDVEREHLLSRWRESRHPEDVARLGRLRGAIEAVDLGGESLVQFVAAMTAETEGAQAATAAEVAEAAYQDAISGDAT